MGRALKIRDDLTAEELRRMASRERSNRAARRLPAIANALDAMSRADAATAAGMERQALRDAVLRCNADGPEGVRDRPLPGRPPALHPFFDRIFRGPDPEKDAVSSWTLPDLCRWVEARLDKRLTPQSLSRILRREGVSRQKVRPTPPKSDEAAQRRFEKAGCGLR